MKNVFFVGIKGVGMTSLAVAMQGAGWTVAGSDTDETFITDDILHAHSIRVVTPVGAEIPDDVDLVIHSAAYEPHVGDRSPSPRVVPLAQALAEFVADRRVIAVAGVGGKTTTSAMLASLFHAAGRDVGYYVGTSTIAGLAGPGHSGSDPYFVVEADEYAISKSDHRPKFALLNPEIVITTNIVHDHPDIYPDEAATVAAFAALINQIPPEGTWIYNPDDRLTQAIIASHKPQCTMIPYDAATPLTLSVFGDQNQLDAQAAVRAATAAGLSRDEAVKNIAAYKGAGRRQEFHGEVAGRLLYDDYGHHPGEIAVTVRSFQANFPQARVVLVFESHTYSRTEALLADFARAIAIADVPFIMPIFESAREKGKEHTITPESFAAQVAKLNSHAVSVTWDNAAAIVAEASQPGDIILTMGAGFVYKLHDKIKALLQ